MDFFSEKKVIYQLLVRLFGNQNQTNKKWGNIQENGVGKFADITDRALQEIKAMGVTHIWYTGVLQHALVGNYEHFGIETDAPCVVKGQAGSPYAIKDYYNVNPDLALNPKERLAEFEQLIERTHRNGLKVIIDIVPNHTARKYRSTSAPEGIKDFGEDDNTSVAFDVNNNYYYIPNEKFLPPNIPTDFQPFKNNINIPYEEFPARWTGNDVREAQPSFTDWYETSKLNFGISPEGKKHFPELPEGFEYEPYQVHFAFWKGKKLPNTWLKFRDIVLFWIEKGVDGFRYDMAQMVPVEFWSFLNSSIKMKNPKAFLLAEIYTPNVYRDYIRKGKMDYLYDKVQLYDTLRAIISERKSTDLIPPILENLADISHRMLRFLENHDEERIASEAFASVAQKALPAMVVLHTVASSPTMIYFGQEVGEPAKNSAGFGGANRTSIFDYIGVPEHQKWLNHGAFDGGKLSQEQKQLRAYYTKLLNINLTGSYKDIHFHNRYCTEFYNDHLYSFVRGDKDGKKWIVISNFDAEQTFGFELQLPNFVTDFWQLPDGKYTLYDTLFQHKIAMQVTNGLGKARIDIKPLESFIFEII